MGFFGEKFGRKENHQEAYAAAVSLRPEGGARYAAKLKEAASLGSPDASFELGIAMSAGAVPGTKAEAKEHIEEAVRRKAPKSKCYLGWSYVTGEFDVRDPRKALEILMQAHEEGDARATNNIGFMHLKGLIGEANPKKAIDFYKVAAERGDSHAPFNLGALHLEGDGLPIDLFAALEWFDMAASRGNPNAPKTAASVREQLKFHSEMEVISRAAGRPYVISIPNKKRAMRDVGRLEAMLESTDVQRALTILQATSQIPAGAIDTMDEVTVLANNIAYSTGIPMHVILQASLAGEAGGVRRHIEAMPD